MKHYAPPLKLPPFHAVQTRARSDGWTPLRQAQFIGHLAQTRSVSAAAKAISMSRESAYRLRARVGAEGFAAVWDMALARRDTAEGFAQVHAARMRALAALAPSRKVTLDALDWRIETGKFQVVMRAGRFHRVRHVLDNNALLCALRRAGLVDAKAMAMPR
ncbi:hypothetical protein FGU71_00995 [Erythrobacter insulae]|uniref:LysR family transcriptional regulator n=1 Tax=Erythrobacter insulae TaxID=2584124 RepID=A0A547P8W1_9SPHN|nr:hypothetical protein [Erythrobacter insulae]TRD10582.1 hypothetical protein FGU71_00995 [Erythrobacter insulae]